MQRERGNERGKAMRGNTGYVFTSAHPYLPITFGRNKTISGTSISNATDSR